ncbi:hypothetical protein [Enterovirga sp. CN4-39]|uniref:hypothetical protein n=1 Tax=Enterovirga sp. CN4-39 TaxID=3400910 RepID=UPI003C08376B
MAGYWSSRRESLYYQAVYKIVAVVGQDATSIIDVGSAETDYIKWFEWIGRKVQLNRGFRTGLEGVERIGADFYKWETPEKFDIGLCLQVLEHVTDATEFCNKLKAISRRLVISVPYKWPAGRHKEHVHDPVDEVKVKSWMGISPNYSLVVREPFGPARLICFYDLENGPSFRINVADANRALRARSQTLGSTQQRTS